MTELRQVDFVTLKRDDNLDVVVAAAGAWNGGQLDFDQGDDGLRRDLQELLNTPLYERLYDPFWGHLFAFHAGAPNGGNILVELRAEWRRLMDRDKRVRGETARVLYDADADEYAFTVQSALTGEIVTVNAGI